MAELTANLSVKALVEQTLMSGNIDDRWSGRSTALEGIRGHQRLQSQRGDGYEAERTVACTTWCSVTGDHVALIAADADMAGTRVAVHLKGRVDGVYPDSEPFAVEEIKTLRGDPGGLPESHLKLHWGQLRIYAHLLLREVDVDVVNLRMCYLDLDTEREHVFDASATREELDQFFAGTLLKYCRMLARRVQWWALRDGTLGVPFPHGVFREGQRALAATAWRTVTAGGEVVLQAPTGIGKTMGVLYPAVRALQGQVREKVFFLTAKTVGRQVAERAVQDMAGAGMRLRAVTITAKAKVCFTGTACDPDVCQYARGYFDRRDDAVEAAFEQQDRLDRAVIETVAREHVVCPFELSLDAARHADVVICDYNYVFDPVVHLRRFFGEDEARPYVFLIDEVHNLVERGREMFSARLIKSDMLAARREAGSDSQTGRLLMRANRWFLDLRREVLTGPDTQVATLDEPPPRLLTRLKDFVAEAESLLRDGLAPACQEALLPVYFDVARFLRTAENFDAASHVTIVDTPDGDGAGRDVRVRLYCVDPAPGLRQGFARSQASVLFSATLFPQPYFARLLGVREETPWYALPSPFEAEHLGTFLVPIRTTYRVREHTAPEVAAAISGLVSARSGNYLIFFPSYAYLALIRQHYVAAAGETVVFQEREMDEDAREAWLAQFRAGARITGFALMGGIFGEGIDLAGERLIGVMIVGVGLPQPDTERDLIRAHFGDVGNDFAYAYPGMQRVLQTAGRLIRSEQDRGVLCLVDARFSQPFYRDLMPAGWFPQTVDAARLGPAARSFWDTGVLPAPVQTREASVINSTMTGPETESASSSAGPI